MENILNLSELTGITDEKTLLLLDYTPHLVGAVVIIVLFLVLYFITSRLFLKALSKSNLAPALRTILVKTIYRWILIVFATIMVLSQLGINVTAAITGVGIAGIAIGFAAKESLSNIMSGFAIFLDKLYQTGDWIEVAGKYGQVKDITLRTTKIRTLDNIFISIPNAQVTLNPVTNFSEEGMVRISTAVSISYDASIEQARKVIIAAMSDIKGVRTDPQPNVVVDKLNESGVDLLVRMWVDDAGTDPFYRFMLTEVVKNALDEAGIEIPLPQRVIHERRG